MPPEEAVASLEARLADACARLDIQSSEVERRRLLAYLQLIEHWNRVFNLTALRTQAEMFTHHLLDCMSIVPALDHWFAATNDHLASSVSPFETLREPIETSAPRHPQLLDVGSGAGLPGVVIAILRPAWRVTCVDAVAKKTAFIRQAGGELGVSNLEVIHGRVESGEKWGAGRFDLIISRAFASLAEFVELTRALRAPTGAWAAMKAQMSEIETSAVPADVELFHVEQLQVPELDAQRRLAWLRPRTALPPVSAVQ